MTEYIRVSPQKSSDQEWTEMVVGVNRMLPPPPCFRAMSSLGKSSAHQTWTEGFRVFNADRCVWRWCQVCWRCVSVPPSTLSPGCCAAWPVVLWSPPGECAALAHAAGLAAICGCGSRPAPGNHGMPDAQGETNSRQIRKTIQIQNFSYTS